MNGREFVLRFVGAFVGVFVVELGTLPAFANIYNSSPGNVNPDFSTAMLYFLLIALVFVFAADVFSGGKPFNLRSGVRIGATYGAVLGIMFASSFLIFTTKGAAYSAASFATSFLNFIVAGALGGFLNERFGGPQSLARFKVPNP